MKITEGDWSKIKASAYKGVEAVKLNSGSFYVKNTLKECGERALLAARILQDFKIITPKTYILNDYCDRDFVYILTEDLNNYGDFKTANQLGISLIINYSIFEIQKQLDKLPPNILEEILIMHFFDLLFSNWDRNCHNWGIVQKDNEMHIATIDHDFMLDKDANCVMSFYKKSAVYNIDAEIEDAKTVLRRDLLSFRKNFPLAFQERWEYFLNITKGNYLENIIKELKIEYPDLFQKYQKMVVNFQKQHQLIEKTWTYVKKIATVPMLDFENLSLMITNRNIGEEYLVQSEIQKNLNFTVFPFYLVWFNGQYYCCKQTETNNIACFSYSLGTTSLENILECFNSYQDAELIDEIIKAIVYHLLIGNFQLEFSLALIDGNLKVLLEPEKLISFLNGNYTNDSKIQNLLTGISEHYYFQLQNYLEIMNPAWFQNILFTMEQQNYLYTEVGADLLEIKSQNYLQNLYEDNYHLLVKMLVKNKIRKRIKK